MMVLWEKVNLRHCVRNAFRSRHGASSRHLSLAWKKRAFAQEIPCRLRKLVGRCQRKGSPGSRQLGRGVTMSLCWMVIRSINETKANLGDTWGGTITLTQWWFIATPGFLHFPTKMESPNPILVGSRGISWVSPINQPVGWLIQGWPGKYCGLPRLSSRST